MDEHAARVTQPLREVYSVFRSGEATLFDLSRVAGQVAMTLDNAHSDLLAAPSGQQPGVRLLRDRA